MKEFSFIIDGQPMSKKRNWMIVRTRAGVPRIALRKQYKEWEKSVQDQLWVQRVEYLKSMTGPWEPIDEPVEATFIFHMRDKKRYDLSNLIQGAEDALVDALIIKDDSQIKSYDGSRVFLGKDTPRILIQIRGFKC